MKKETYGLICLGIGIILTILWLTFYIIGREDAIAAGEYRLKGGEIITLYIGKPTQVATKHKNKSAIFTYTGKVRNYYTIDYQSCDGRSGTGTQSYCEPHKIFLKDDLVEIDIYIFEIKSCVWDCRTILTLEFIQYK